MIFERMAIEVSDDGESWERLSAPEDIRGLPGGMLTNPATKSTLCAKARAAGKRFARMRVDGGSGWQTHGEQVDVESDCGNDEE